MNVRKPSGEIEEYDPRIVEESILRAMKENGKEDRQEAAHVTEVVSGAVRVRYRGEIQAGEIMDLTEAALIENGHAKVAKAYILRREKLKKIREIVRARKNNLDNTPFLAVWGEMDEFKSGMVNGVLLHYEYLGVIKGLQAMNPRAFTQGVVKDGLYGDTEFRQFIQNYFENRSIEVGEDLCVSPNLTIAGLQLIAFRAGVADLERIVELSEGLPKTFSVQTRLYSGK